MFPFQLQVKEQNRENQFEQRGEKADLD